MSTHLMWFRSDLRIRDNLALAAACKDQDAHVIAMFIATPQQWLKHSMSSRQASFIRINLNDLQRSLAQKGIPLLYMQTDNFKSQNQLIYQICQQKKVTHLFYNYQYELNECRRDQVLEKSLNNSVILKGFHDSVILAPGEVLTKNFELHKVFTSFKYAWIKRLKAAFPIYIPDPIVRKNGPINDKLLPNLQFNYSQMNFSTSLFPATEKEALIRLKTFCQESLVLYENNKNYPSIKNGTSQLSPCLMSGLLSPRQCLYHLLKICPQAIDGKAGSMWLNEIIWREFYRHRIAYYPDLCKFEPFISWSKNIDWKNNTIHFQAWKQGKTGYPIVDAAMRQLNKQGWINNRLRMIVASFLVKDLLVDWRIGERYFISQLIDGDLAANIGGWQWISSTGMESYPYFRVFNPTIQSKKFDPNGQFIRRWLPELNIVPKEEIHTPWEWANKFNITLDYPYPIVNHKQAKIITLETYKKARNT